MTFKNLFYGLGILDETSVAQRIIRRALILALITFLGQIIVGAPTIVNPAYLPLVVALLGGLEKALRESL